MSGEMAAARAHPAVIAAIVVAAIAVTACSLVGIAYMVGWIPARAAPTPTGFAIPGQQLAGSAQDVALAPGETLVTAPDKSLAAVSSAPSPLPLPPSPSTSPPPARAVTPATRAAPTTPRYARAMPPVISNERAARSICINCGTVASVRSSQGEWEVRVRFEDGSSETLTYPQRPSFKPGARVRLEQGRLVAD
jgi:hypothetical protein